MLRGQNKQGNEHRNCCQGDESRGDDKWAFERQGCKAHSRVRSIYETLHVFAGISQQRCSLPSSIPVRHPRNPLSTLPLLQPTKCQIGDIAKFACDPHHLVSNPFLHLADLQLKPVEHRSQLGLHPLYTLVDGRLDCTTVREVRAGVARMVNEKVFS